VVYHETLTGIRRLINGDQNELVKILTWSRKRIWVRLQMTELKTLAKLLF